MSLWREIFDPAVEDPDDPYRHEPVPEGMVRLHVFAGTFESEEAALSYCYDAPDTRHPEPLTDDLEDATIDTTYVDVAFGADIPAVLAGFFKGDDLSILRQRIEGANTLVLISEYAFRGLPYALSDTPRLVYHGAFLVAAA